MISPEVAELFPPHWLAESGPSEVLWPWAAPPPARPEPAMVIGREGELLHYLTRTPTPGGSYVRDTTAGIVMHLAEADKREMTGQALLFCLWADDAFAKPEDTSGALIVSDWATAPHRGEA